MGEASLAERKMKSSSFTPSLSGLKYSGSEWNPRIGPEISTRIDGAETLTISPLA
jgi:hypothetical protein